MSVKCFSSQKSSEGAVQNCPHFWHQLQVQGLPQTILRFNNSLKGLTESCYTHSCSLSHRKDPDENQPRKEIHRTESKSFKFGASEVLFLWSHRQCEFLLAIMCDRTHGVPLTGKAHLTPSAQSFYWESVIWAFEHPSGLFSPLPELRWHYLTQSPNPVSYCRYGSRCFP